MSTKPGQAQSRLFHFDEWAGHAGFAEQLLDLALRPGNVGRAVADVGVFQVFGTALEIVRVSFKQQVRDALEVRYRAQRQDADPA